MISFFVPGVPRPGGSKTTGYNYKTGKRFVRDAGKHTKEWRQQVSYFAMKAYQGKLLDEPVLMDVIFIMPRPKNHYRSNGQLKPNAQHYHGKQPDRGKLLRSTEDALTGIIWRDDSLVATGVVEKIYGEKPGAEIKIDILGGEIVEHRKDDKDRVRSLWN